MTDPVTERADLALDDLAKLIARLRDDGMFTTVAAIEALTAKLAAVEQERDDLADALTAIKSITLDPSGAAEAYRKVTSYAVPSPDNNGEEV